MTVKRKREIALQRVIANRPRLSGDKTDRLIARLTCIAIMLILAIMAVRCAPIQPKIQTYTRIWK
jgi:hypothetical protein